MKGRGKKPFPLKPTLERTECIAGVFFEDLQFRSDVLRSKEGVRTFHRGLGNNLAADRFNELSKQAFKLGWHSLIVSWI